MSAHRAITNGDGLADIEHWIRSARGGCSDSLGKLSERCRRYLLLVANRELDDELRVKVAASDLVQETLLHAQKYFGRFNGQSDEELRAWLRHILLNRIVNAARTYRGAAKREIGREERCGPTDSGHRNRDQLADKAASPSQQAIVNEQALAMEQALGQLPSDYRQVITLRSIERQSFSEIGRVMHRSAEAARKLWLRAIKQLEQVWDQSDGAG